MKYKAEIGKKAYDADGYVIVHDLVDLQTLLKLREAMERITKNPETLAPI
jgi:hypothetical protein